MYKGFYNLTSGMLTQQRHLNVVGNNMVNISTSGFKESRYTATTFDDVMYSRVGNKEKVYTDIGRQSYIRANSEITVIYDQGIPEPTNIPLDFAIMGDGFFAIQDDEGNTAYTRAGNFSLDDEGYLCLPGMGQVLSPQRQPIYLGTDKIEGDRQGIIYYTADNSAIAQLGIFAFEDNGVLERNERGMFFDPNGDPQAVQTPDVLNKYLERSNSDMVKQMTEMITFQRSLQSAAQVSGMYDQMMSRITQEIGRMQ